MQILDQAPDERVAALFHHQEPHLLPNMCCSSALPIEASVLDQADMETERDGLAGQGQQLRKIADGCRVAGLDVLDQCRRLGGRIDARSVFSGHGRPVWASRRRCDVDASQRPGQTRPSSSSELCTGVAPSFFCRAAPSHRSDGHGPSRADSLANPG